jgi:hypothetical protein
MNVRETLYLEGLRLALRFLKKNRIAEPVFMTYDEALSIRPTESTPLRLLAKVSGGPAVGSGTGLYSHGYVFVNVPATALPVEKPGYRNWSYPGWKTDRTAVGVVAHELGHYVEHQFQKEGRLIYGKHGELWREVIVKNRKRISGYEPVPSEAWAETMRLFILNPDLLRHAIPARYEFIRAVGLKPSERRNWYEVIPNQRYWETGERWILQ